MQRLNAIDALAPAFTRTQEVILQPFRLGRSWKLAASSYVAYTGSIFIPLPLMFLFVGRFMPDVPRAAAAAFWIGGTTFSLVYLALIYCGARMELVEFELIVTRGKFIAPLWRKYGIRVWPWIAAKLLIGSVLFCCFLPFLYRSGRRVFQLGSLHQPGAQSDPAALAGVMGAMLHFYVVFFSVLFLLKLSATLLTDFVLPFYVLEAMPLLSAIERSVDVVQRDPLQVGLYLILKPVLAVFGFIVQYSASLLCMVPIAIIFGLPFAAGIAISRRVGESGHLVLLSGGILLYLAAVGCFMYVLIGLFGYLLTLLDAYAIFFLGGRYPLLGKLLEPGPDRSFTPPPVFPSPEEQEDDDDPGPPMPMDPALA